MSIKSKVLAVAATMTMVGGVSAVGLLPADASTGPCGKACLSVFSQEFGSGFVLDVLRQGEKAGQPIILFRTSNSDPAEDFTILDQGTVADYYADTTTMYAVYGADEAYELEYSPYGVDSGLCVGVGSKAGNGTPVALEQCGVSDATLWVVDADGVTTASPDTYYPWINGSNTNFSNPYVLHYPGSAYPTDMPRPQLNTWGLQQYSNTASFPTNVFNNELWSGLYPPSS